ncbi:Arogenate dehydratase [Rhynchospora pubera]|uniref:arogenate dehydratase n=1 Tax=Rhynchospora pubera TaxID=906938 RepID=A0AAV8BR00_9POAL|nr:Arogenate dehydratase [Rhynchospora pubera]
MALKAIGNGVGGVCHMTPRACLHPKSSLSLRMVERKESEKEMGPSPSSSNPQDQFKGLRSGDLEKNARALTRDCNSLPKPLSSMDCSTSSDGSAIRVAYQGSPGSFSEDAALKAYPHCVRVPCEHFEVALKAVELWHVDRAVLPIENTSVGSIHRNYDLLLSHRLHIIGEVQIKVDLCLLALPGAKKEDIQRVFSHLQAFQQCEKSISDLKAIRINFEDTASAARLIAERGMRDAGAIASARAGELYGLNILQNKLHDEDANITRFLVLSREPILPKTYGPFKTSIVFTLEEGAGMLFKALAVFALRNINILKIESRPLRTSPLRLVDDLYHGTTMYFEYLFYIDFEASMAETRAQNALGHLQEFSKFLRVLGCYPVDTLL